MPARTSSAKKAKPKKRTLADAEADLVIANNKLTAAQTEIDTLKDKFRFVSKKIVDNANGHDLEEFNISPDTDPASLSVDCLTELLSRIYKLRDKLMQDKLEQRIEELETRISQQSVQIAELLRLTLVYQAGLEEIHTCNTMFMVKQRLEGIRRKIFDTDLGRYEQAAVDAYNVKPDYYNPPFDRRPASVGTSSTSLVLSPATMERPPTVQTPVADYIRLSTYHDLDLPRKLPGDTHISMLSRELRHAIVSELNIEKPNRADWRLLAERVGISVPQIEDWYIEGLSNPGEVVLSVWGRSQGATVRLLYRHLFAPQLRYLVAARLLADSYDV